MTQPTKDNAHIASNEHAFRAAYQRARGTFATIEGVVGVGFGLKQTGGEFKDDIAIVVFVAEKKDEAALPLDQRIPPTFEGYRTDVRVVPQVRPGACDNETSYDIIQGGIQIAPKATVTSPTSINIHTGTLGCVVRKRADSGRDNVYLLSNKHVLHTLTAGVGDYIYHPFPPESSKTSAVLGPVQAGGTYGNVPVVVTPGTPPENFFIDCAVARLDIDSRCCGSTCTQDTTRYAESIVDLLVNGVNTMSDVRNIIGDVSTAGAIVTKVGRTSGRTQGRIVGVHAAFNSVGDPSIAGSAPLTGQNCIEISFDVSSTPTGLNCKGHAWFAEQGDSGSIVVDAQNRVVGIISQVPPPGAPIATSSIACHIVPVLDSLNVCIPCTTGTSYGSSRATDGSGIAPAALAVNQSRLPDGQIVFTAEPGFTPRAVTDEEVHHMRELLADFRDTRLGPQLHYAFASVRREIGYLVRNSRRVKAAWARCQGPAFFAHVLNHLAGHADCVPHEVQGVARRTLLVRMREVLSAHGSNPLREALERFGDDLLEMLTHEGCDSVADCLAWLQEREPA